MNTAVAAKNGLLIAGEYDLSIMLSEVSQNMERDYADASTFLLDDKEGLSGMRGSTLTTQFLRKGSLAAYQQLLENAIGNDDEPHLVCYSPDARSAGNDAILMYANQTSAEIGASLNEIVGGAITFGATGGARRGVLLHTNRGTDSITSSETQTLTFGSVPQALELALRAINTEEVFVFNADDSNADIKSGIEGLDAYSGLTATVTGTLTTDTDSTTGETLYSGTLTIAFSGTSDVPNLQVLTSTVHQYKVVAGDNDSDYGYNASAGDALGFSEGDFQTAIRATGGDYASAVAKGTSVPNPSGSPSGSGVSGSSGSSGSSAPNDEGSALFNIYLPYSVGDVAVAVAAGTGSSVTKVYSGGDYSSLVDEGVPTPGGTTPSVYNVIDTTAAGATIDGTAASANGWIAQLHVLYASGTGPELDVIIEHSDDGNTWSTLTSFTQATDITAERKVSATRTAAVSRYVRTSYTVAGTSANFVFCVALTRHV